MDMVCSHSAYLLRFALAWRGRRASFRVNEALATVPLAYTPNLRENSEPHKPHPLSLLVYLPVKMQRSMSYRKPVPHYVPSPPPSPQSTFPSSSRQDLDLEIPPVPFFPCSSFWNLIITY